MKLIWHFLSSRCWARGSQGCLCRAGFLAVLAAPLPSGLQRAFRACWWGRGNSRFVCSSLYLFCEGHVALFVCSRFWWLEIVMDKWIIGFQIYFCMTIPLSRPYQLAARIICILDFSLQNTLSARQWSHYFNILDIYYLLTFTVVQPASWRWWEGMAVSGTFCLKYQKKTVLSFWIISCILFERVSMLFSFLFLYFFFLFFPEMFLCVRSDFARIMNERKSRPVQ